MVLSDSLAKEPSIKKADMMDGRKWSLLADKTLEWICIARENGFCLDLLHIIKKRLFSLSPFHKDGRN